MSDADLSYQPPSAAPLDVAQRLKGYIDRAARLAEDEREHPDPQQPHARPTMMYGLVQDMMSQVLRLEYQLRCFILFLAAELIALGELAAPPDRRPRKTDSGKSLIQLQDEALRDALAPLPRLARFSVLTPLIHASGSKRRRSRAYRLLTDRLEVVDAGHVFARLKRLAHVLSRADRFAMSLACRAVAADPNPADERICHPLWFEPLACFLPPECHWQSAPDEAEQADVNFIHYLAQSRLEAAGFGIRPDPYAGLPDLACLDPPPPPQLRTL